MTFTQAIRAAVYSRRTGERKEEILIGAFEEEKMLGCCMLIKEGPISVRLRQMAVLNNLQGKGIGRALMQFAENIARDRGFRK